MISSSLFPNYYLSKQLSIAEKLSFFYFEKSLHFFDTENVLNFHCSLADKIQNLIISIQYTSIFSSTKLRYNIPQKVICKFNMDFKCGRRTIQYRKKQLYYTFYLSANKLPQFVYAYTCEPVRYHPSHLCIYITSVSRNFTQQF